MLIALVIAASFPVVSTPVADTIEFMPLRGSMLGDCAEASAPSAPCRLRRQWTAAAIEARLTKAGELSVLGDTITFIARSTGIGLRVMGGITMAMAHLPATDLWVLDLVVPDAQTARFNYRIDDGRSGSNAYLQWRGPRASAPPRTAAALGGRIQRDTISSAFLSERREVVTYFPPGWNAKQRGRTVLLADGQAVPDFARVLEPQIIDKTVAPTVIIGIASSSERMGQVRTSEYVLLASADSARFLAHERFVLEEVLPWAAKQGIDLDRSVVTTAGLSNGAAFALLMALRHPDRFSSVIALSPAGPAIKTIASQLPIAVYLMAGSLEPAVLRGTLISLNTLKAGGVNVTMATRVTAHEQLAWEEEFAPALEWLNARLPAARPRSSSRRGR